jgi:hypothetical protein
MSILSSVWRSKVQMILKDMVLTSQLGRESGASIDKFRKKYKGKCDFESNRNFIHKSLLTTEEREIAKRCDNFDDYLPLSYFASHVLDVSCKTVRHRIRFAKTTGIDIIEYKEVNRLFYIKIPKQLQEKLKHGIPRAISNWDQFNWDDEIRDHYLFGDWVIVLY